MLCQFSVRNYKSIKEEITLDMQAASISEHPEHLLTDIDNESFLPIAAIYGPNGGGKSNVLQAMSVLIKKIMVPICAVRPNNECGDGYDSIKSPIIETFKFSDKNRKSPTQFELFFRTEKLEYKYNIDILGDKVMFESLYKKSIDSTRKTLLFERNINTEKEYRLNGSFKNFKISELSDNIPLLSYITMTYGKNAIALDIFRWLESGISILNFGSYRTDNSLNLKELENYKDILISIFKELDIDIADYRIIDKENDFDIMTKHIIDGDNCELNLSEESSGTKRLFAIMPRILKSLVIGTTLVIDELDAKLHPKLLRYIIELYSDKKINTKKAQLIFTSHDLSTMNSDVFRRDEIWFVAKNNEQATSLYSLVEFKDEDGKSIRKDARFDKQYLEGRYGADPYLRRIIDWEGLANEV